MQHDFILLDRTGSMVNLWDEAISSINGYVEKLADDNIDTGVTLACFDSNGGVSTFDILRDRIIPKTWAKVSKTEVQPRGLTPLNDAIGKIVGLAKLGYGGVQYDRLALIIMTDGYENASREVNNQQAKALLDECRAKGWQVIMLGANYDPTAQATVYGVAAQNTSMVLPEKLGAAMTATASMRGAYATTGADMSFTDDQRKQFSEGSTPKQ